MPIIVLCPGCRVRLTLADDRGGETFECPRCDRSISVPVVLPAIPASAPSPDKSLPPAPPLAPPVECDWPSSEPEEEEDYRPRNRSRSRRKTRKLWVWALIGVSVLAFVGATLGIRFLVHRAGFVAQVPGRSEPNSSNLAELITDLQSKRDVVSIVTGEEKELDRVARILLPPDREYETAILVINLKSTADGPVILCVIDCTSQERATLFVEWLSKAGGLNPVGGKKRMNWSGRFAFYGPEESLKWLGKYYPLR